MGETKEVKTTISFSVLNGKSLEVFQQNFFFDSLSDEAIHEVWNKILDAFK